MFYSHSHTNLHWSVFFSLYDIFSVKKCCYTNGCFCGAKCCSLVKVLVEFWIYQVLEIFKVIKSSQDLFQYLIHAYCFSVKGLAINDTQCFHGYQYK